MPPCLRIYHLSPLSLHSYTHRCFIGDRGIQRQGNRRTTIGEITAISIHAMGLRAPAIITIAEYSTVNKLFVNAFAAHQRSSLHGASPATRKRRRRASATPLIKRIIKCHQRVLRIRDPSPLSPHSPHAPGSSNPESSAGNRRSTIGEITVAIHAGLRLQLPPPSANTNRKQTGQRIGCP